VGGLEPSAAVTQALVADARRGDRAALDALFARHQRRLLALIRVLIDPAPAAHVAPDDVLQETLIEAARKIATFEDRGGASFYRWLVAIARFKVAEARRAGRRSAVAPFDAEPAAGDTAPALRVERDERAARLREALDRIAPEQAAAVRLRYLEGFTVEETAERMGKTAAAVKSLVSRGLDALSSRVTAPSTF